MPLAAVAAIGIAGSIGGAAIASHGANSAAETQASAADRAAQLNYQASQNALNFQKDQWQQQQTNAAPWLQSGTAGLANLDYLLGIKPPTTQGTVGASSAYGQPTGPLPGYQSANPQSYGQQPAGLPPSAMPYSGPTTDLGSMVNTNLGGFGSLMQPYAEKFTAPTDLTEQNDPGFQARLKLGTDSLQRSAAARGGVLTGGTAQALNQFGQDYASNEYDKTYNRALTGYTTNYNTYNQQQTNAYNRLAALAGVGMQTAQQLGQAGQAASNNVSSNLLNTANSMGQQYNNAAAATASGYAAGANAYGGAFSGIGNNLSNLYMLQQMNGGGSGALTVNPNTGQILTPGYGYGYGG